MLFPKKYAPVEYRPEFSSFKKTSLSAGNYITVGWNGPIKLVKIATNIAPEIFYNLA